MLSARRDLPLRKALIAALTVFLNGLPGFGAEASGKAGSAKESKVSAGELVIIPYAPIPLAHLWRYDPETVQDCVKPTLRKALELIQKFPSFRFSVGEVPLLEPVSLRYPEVWKSCAEAFKKGGLGLTGASFTWFLGLGPSGETLVREFLYGKAFWKEEFGLSVETCWLVGAKGLPASMPAILKGCGIKVCFLGAQAPYPVFRWKAPSGDEVIAVRVVESTVGEDLGSVISKSAESPLIVALATKEHGGGLTEKLVKDMGTKLAKKSLKVHFATPAEAFSLIKSKKELPTFEGRFDSATPGEATTLGRVKGANRTAENLLLSAERFVAVASRYGPPLDQALKEAWKNLLFTQERNLLGGRTVPAATEDTLALYDQIETLVKPTLDKALQLLTLHIDTRFLVNPVVVFNPLGWERSGEVITPVPDPEVKDWMARDDEGKFHAVQKIVDPATQQESLLFVAKHVPAFGYRVYSIIPAPQKVFNPCRVTQESLENPNFQVILGGPASDVAQIRSKDYAWQLLVGAGNELQILEEEGDSEGNLNFTGRTFKAGPFNRREIVEGGPVRVAVRIRNRLLGEHTTFVREISLTCGLPWVRFTTYIEWNSAQRLVKASFPVSVTSSQAFLDGPFCPVQRPADGHERFGRLWADLSDGEKGIALLNGNRSGYDIRPGLIRLSLLRSPIWPARNDEGGNHTVSYALYPHRGDWREGEVWKRAWEFNVPLLAVPSPVHSGALPRKASFFSVEPASVMLSCIKRAENGSGLVLRLVEMEGKETEAVLRSHWFLRGVYSSDMLEREISRLESEGDKVRLHLRPHEVKTILLKDWGFAPLK